MGYEEDRRARALAIYAEMGWGENEGVKDADEDLWKIITDIMFGEIWSRPGLSLRDREMVTLAALIMDKADGMKLHMQHAQAHHETQEHRAADEDDVCSCVRQGTSKSCAQS